MRITPIPHGVAVHFPPLRSGGAPLALALFGALCIALPLLALPGLVPGGEDAHGLLAIALIGIFIVPFPAFGAAFMALAVYALANSLHVQVDETGIRTVRRVFGLVVARSAIGRAEIAALELQRAPAYRSVLSAAGRFNLVARHVMPRGRDVVVAEDIEGREAAARLHEIIARHAGLQPAGAAEQEEWN